MASNPGEWYEERRLEAEHAEWAIQHLLAYLRRLDDRPASLALRVPLTEYLTALVRALEQARYVGD